ncbi:uncharacterized protein [Cherax quadricarinatus]|uniref:uncharacterized protein n=1 Tax=Cherax quadricarinatus TaxID=27406 RepID=UPI00387E7801
MPDVRCSLYNARYFRYWEDASDEYHPMMGSLLPLWRFRPHTHYPRSLALTDVSWSPVHPDIFAAAYTTGGVYDGENAGLVCVYTLKNPATPDRVFQVPSGVNTLHFHPQVGRLVVAGCSDGTVVVYDISSRDSTASIVHSTTDNGKHLLSVSQVRHLKSQNGWGLNPWQVSPKTHRPVC